jgi:hypothetical protein
MIDFNMFMGEGREGKGVAKGRYFVLFHIT